MSLDGVCATFGRFGSAAMRGSGLPGSTVPGFAERRRRRARSARPGRGRAGGGPGAGRRRAGRLRRRLGGRARRRCRGIPAVAAGEQVTDPVEDVGDDVAVPPRARARCRGGRARTGRRSDRPGRDGAGARGGPTRGGLHRPGLRGQAGGGEAEHHNATPRARGSTERPGSSRVGGRPGSRPIVDRLSVARSDGSAGSTGSAWSAGSVWSARTAGCSGSASSVATGVGRVGVQAKASALPMMPSSRPTKKPPRLSPISEYTAVTAATIE